MTARTTLPTALLTAGLGLTALVGAGCGDASAPVARDPVEPQSPTSTTSSTPPTSVTPPPSPVPPRATRVPEGFPITWDATDATGDGGELIGPGPEATGVQEISPCGRTGWPAAGVVDRVAFRTTGPEWEESRELAVLESAGAAQAVLTELRADVEACPTEVNELDPTDSPAQIWELMEDAGPGGSLTFSLTYADGMPGGAIWQVTQVGHAVLAVGTSGEYTAGHSTSLAARRLGRLTDHLVPEMCSFDDGGC